MSSSLRLRTAQKGNPVVGLESGHDQHFHLPTARGAIRETPETIMKQDQQKPVARSRMYSASEI